MRSKLVSKMNQHQEIDDSMTGAEAIDVDEEHHNQKKSVKYPHFLMATSFASKKCSNGYR